MQLRQSLRLDGKKVCNIKRADISQAGRNKATVCVVPSSHLPLTREARTWCEARDSAKQTERSFKGKGVGDFRGIVRFWKGWCRANYGRANALKF